MKDSMIYFLTAQLFIAVALLNDEFHDVIISLLIAGVWLIFYGIKTIGEEDEK